MITAIVTIEHGVLVTQFPTDPVHLYDQLGSIGIATCKRDVPVLGNNNIKVELVADGKLGEAILKRLTEKDDTLCGLNAVCNLIARHSPWGDAEFLDMLEPQPGGRYEPYKPYETIPPTIYKGIKGLLEEVERYNATMNNYRKKFSEGEED